MLSFIDVSGDPYSSPEKSKWIVIAGIFLKRDCIDEINQSMHRLKRDTLGNERIELKATELINRSTLSYPNLNKHKYIDGLMSNCIYSQGCSCCAVIFENSGNNNKSTNERLPKHYRDILWRIEALSRSVRVKDTLVILDNDSRRIDRDLAFAFTNYMYRNDSAVDLHSIIPVPIFADSETTSGLQLADIVAGILRKYNELDLGNTDARNISLFEQKLIEYTRIITSKSICTRIKQYKINGIYHPNSPYII